MIFAPGSFYILIGWLKLFQ